MLRERLEIVAVILERLGHRLPDSLEGREMNHGVDMVVGEKPADGRGVAEVHLDERQLPAENAADAFVVRLVAIGHVVRYHYIITGLRQLHRHMASDKSGAAETKYGLWHILKIELFLSAQAVTGPEEPVSPHQARIYE